MDIGVQSTSSPPPPAASDPSNGDHLAARDPVTVDSFEDRSFPDHPQVQEVVKESAPPAAGSPPDSDDATDSSGATDQYDDLRHKIVRQVEYYFSDENLPTDKFLMKQMKKDKEGYVPIAVISYFRKMKKLTKDLRLIESALRTSSLLVVSSDGKKVKRLLPLPVTEVKDVKPRIVIVENLPEDHSEENIRRIFGNVGHILDITIHDPAEESTTTKKGDLAISSKLHALIEYETVEAAENAVSILNDEMNWRTGMQVGLLLKRMEKYGLIQKAWKENISEENHDSEASEMPVLPDDGLLEKKENEDHPDGVQGGQRSKYKSRLAGCRKGHRTIPSGSITEDGRPTIKPVSGPRMPDGTRGFTMGRGRTMAT